MISTPTTFLVIRTGKLDEEDAIREVESIIERHGFCWFGKYGQPLNKKLKDDVASSKKKFVVTLVQKDQEGEGGYRHQSFNLVDVTAGKPKDGVYPEYYRRVMRRIHTWFRLQKYSGKRVLLSDLVVKSSISPVLRSLRDSMRGHFVCYSRSTN